MTTFTSRAFEQALGLQFRSTEEFLKYFKKVGFYLDDLSQAPVDHLKGKERNAALKLAIPRFAERLTGLRPPIVVIVLKKIERFVRAALDQAGIDAQIFVLPFPGQGHQVEFINGLSEIVCNHVK